MSGTTATPPTPIVEGVPEPIRASEDGVLVDVLVQPNASRAEIVGPHGDRIKVRVTAAPERLAANAAVADLLCTVCGARSAAVVAGRTNRHKTVALAGAEVEAVRVALGRRRKAR